MEVSSRLPRAMAAGSAPCLNSEALRLICTSNSPGADFSNVSLNTVHILACQASGTAGVEMRSTVLVCATAGHAKALRTAAAANSVRRLKWREVGIGNTRVGTRLSAARKAKPAVYY